MRPYMAALHHTPMPTGFTLLASKRYQAGTTFGTTPAQRPPERGQN
nr:MAG TPA: hypothetical protein [Caudoviricetes sp.]